MRQVPLIAAAASSKRNLCLRAAAQAHLALQRNLTALSSALQRHHQRRFQQRQGSSPEHQRSLAEQALLAAAGLAAAVCLHLSDASGAQAFNLASVVEDSLLQIVRQVEARIGSAVDGVQAAAGADGGGSPADSQEARDLVNEVWDVVENNFTDVRNGRFDHAHWQQLKEEALARPLRNTTSAYRCCAPGPRACLNSGRHICCCRRCCCRRCCRPSSMPSKHALRHALSACLPFSASPSQPASCLACGLPSVPTLHPLAQRDSGDAG